MESVFLLPHLPGLQRSNSKSSGLYSKCIYTLSHLTGPHITHFESSFSMATNVTSENIESVLPFPKCLPFISSICHMYICPDYFLAAELIYTSKSNLRKKGLFWLSVIEEHSPSWWGHGGRHGGRNRSLAWSHCVCCQEQGVNRKWGLAIKPQGLHQVTHLPREWYYPWWTQSSYIT